MRDCGFRWWLLPISLVGVLVAVSPLRAQLLDRLGGGFDAPGFEQEEVVTVEGQFTVPTAAAPAALFVTAKLAPGYHIYSITQAPGGPKRTEIKLDPSDAYELLATSEPSPPPRKRGKASGTTPTWSRRSTTIT